MAIETGEIYKTAFDSDFAAQLTAVTTVNGVHRYAFTEQSFNPSTGAYRNANPARKGDGAVSYALTQNSELLALPCYATLRLRGIVQTSQGASPVFDVTNTPPTPSGVWLRPLSHLPDGTTDLYPAMPQTWTPGEPLVVDRAFSDAGTSTTVSSNIASGVGQVVTPASMTGIVVGTKLMVVDTTGVNAAVTVTAVTATTFTATFPTSFAAPITLYLGAVWLEFTPDAFGAGPFGPDADDVTHKTVYRAAYAGTTSDGGGASPSLPLYLTRPWTFGRGTAPYFALWSAANGADAYALYVGAAYAVTVTTTLPTGSHNGVSAGVLQLSDESPVWTNTPFVADAVNQYQVTSLGTYEQFWYTDFVFGGTLIGRMIVGMSPSGGNVPTISLANMLTGEDYFNTDGGQGGALYTFYSLVSWLKANIGLP